jgi:hypothetical protein
VKRALALPLLLFALLGGALACGGDEETVFPFEVTLRTMEDCSVLGQGALNCADEASLQALEITARWVFDYRGRDTFVLLTDTGRTLPGVYFRNNGNLVTGACGGEGGTCLFSRTTSSGDDPQSGCPRVVQHVVDVRAVDGELVGQTVSFSATEEGCGTQLQRRLAVEVRGVALDEAVHAREAYTP